MKIKFCGAAREVTGSSHLLTLKSGYKILLDCGTYQGRNDALDDFNQGFQFDPKEIDCVILSHAHIDHSGRIPLLVKQGFRGDIYSTHATRSLAAIMLLDSAGILERDAYHATKYSGEKEEPLYTTEDVDDSIRQFIGLSYERWHYVTDGVKVLFRDAGHILGSANVTLEIKEDGKTTYFGFTGDIGRPDRPILRDPQPMPPVDYLISESTYGNKEHESAPEELNHLLEIIKEVCVKNKGKLLIPAFSIGRTQELVYMLDQMETEGILPKIPVFVDSPLAVDATEIFGLHPECFDEYLNAYMQIDSNPFGFKDLHYVRKLHHSKRLNKRRKACIIISASGMANGGRIRHHIFNSIENKRNACFDCGLLCCSYLWGTTSGW